MYAKIEDLRKGDVVLVASSQGIFDAKILRDPKKAKLGRLKTWGGSDRWVTIPCAIRIDTITQYPLGHTGTVRTYSFKKKVLSNGRDFNAEVRLDFSEREVWIIKREI